MRIVFLRVLGAIRSPPVEVLVLAASQRLIATCCNSIQRGRRSHLTTGSFIQSGSSKPPKPFRSNKLLPFVAPLLRGAWSSSLSIQCMRKRQLMMLQIERLYSWTTSTRAVHDRSKRDDREVITAVPQTLPYPSHLGAISAVEHWYIRLRRSVFVRYERLFTWSQMACKLLFAPSIQHGQPTWDSCHHDGANNPRSNRWRR